MANITFEELKIVAESLDINYEALMNDEQSRKLDEPSPSLKFSEKQWDCVHALMVILDELYKFRPLPF